MNWKRRIQQREVRVGIVGLGYVGLPLAVAFARNGFDVVGFDVDADKVGKIEAGQSPLEDLASDPIHDLVEEGGLVATTDMERMGEVDALSICVPTPLRKSRDPDISYIAEAAENIHRHFTPPGLVTLESTTYPGTTEEILAERFRDRGWDLEREVLLAFSPERIDPGNEQWGIENTPKVVGGYNARAGEVASRLYGSVIDRIVTVSSTRSAEMVKLLENTFRSVNIGLANEIALLCDRMDIDVWEVIEAASSKPYGFMPFYPGPGLGGHCIPVDPLFLSWKARLHNTSSRFIELADEINRSMPGYVFRKLADGLNKFEKSVKGSRVCVFGVAYKPDVDDTRESPAIDVIKNVLDREAEVVYCDPHVESFDVLGETIPRVELGAVPEQEYDAALILTDHSRFNWERLLRCAPLVVDTRDALPSPFPLEDITRISI